MKRKTDGSPQFSRDPLNLTNIHSRKVRHIQASPETAQGQIANIYFSMPASSTTR
ncbi:hypothetical protein IMZ48_05475 [Candidatus Bathyarchaeota archaeon]|nr:hypothetical protein [Candidatus Bathyarchaeota archaeon]